MEHEPFFLTSDKHKIFPFFVVESGCVPVSDLSVTQPSWTESGVRTGVCSHCLPLNKLSQWLIEKQQQHFVELCINSSFIKGSISYVEWTRLLDTV